jgi:NAD(P)-dependent dehydrogenase (short-subunit alcohol dehydrogenase family)
LEEEVVTALSLFDTTSRSNLLLLSIEEAIRLAFGDERNSLFQKAACNCHKLRCLLDNWGNVLTYDSQVSDPLKFFLYSDRATGHEIGDLIGERGKAAEPDWGVYSASKYAFFGLTEAIHFDLIKHGIKVTAICPSWVDTNMAQQAATPYKSDEMIQKEDILNTIRWLVKMSPKAAIKEVVIDCLSK